MNKRVFIDTGAFIALANASDQYHEDAKKVLDELTASKYRFLTSNFVLDETYTRIRRKSGLKAAVIFGEQIQSKPGIDIISIDKSLEKKAWSIFKKYSDHPFSYTDCTSFAIMQEKKLLEAFAFDKDFVIIGFKSIPALF